MLAKHFLLKDTDWCPADCTPYPWQKEPCTDCPLLKTGKRDPQAEVRYLATIVALLTLLVVLGVAVMGMD